MLAAAASADDVPPVLSLKGSYLGILKTDGKIADLRLTVDLAGDTPEKTHVWAIIGSSVRRQRTNEGYWIPWDGNPETLIDNHLSVTNGMLVFKVVDEDIAADNYGITINVGYRTPAGLKYGMYGLVPKEPTP
ncbi:MAG: hypothetical protein EXQ86_03665 [Rhodospirillales bacterium]|nr:hypothetical protein [Rhodospirillales bacterium]